MKKLLYPFVVLALMACGEKQQAPIDREALVDRNSPQVTAFDSLASLSVGNGEFAFTVDATGLQTFPEMYTKGEHKANGAGMNLQTPKGTGTRKH